MSPLNEQELAEVQADAIKLSELAGAALARLWEGGCRLANFPNDESLDMNLAELNYRAWALRWRLGLSDGVGGAPDADADAERDLEVLRQAAEAKHAVTP